ncbi:MAG: amidohydrolase/deacetylase family metallohydrolase [Bryobacteraceae bacterium]
MLDRRNFIYGAGAVLASRDLFAAEYDLVVRGGRVLDPSQKLDRVTDVAVKGGKIAAIGPNLVAGKTVDAKGKLVVPGLIDFHMHAGDLKLTPAEVLSTGVTTFLDGGSRGADNLDELVGVAKNANRMRIFINIARLGNNNSAGRGEFLDGLGTADIAKCQAAIERNREYVIGIKARLSRGVALDQDVEVLRRARVVADAVKLPIMIHIGDTFSPLPKLLAMLRPGDIVTHPYAPPPHGIFDDKGKILPEVFAARKRGVLFDFGNGRLEHWTWDLAQSALKQGFAPDMISTDLNLTSRTDQVFDLPTTMSKFLALGMPLHEVVARVTIDPARAMKPLNGLGTLRKGAVADITVLTLTEGSFDFLDNANTVRKGTQKLSTHAVIAGGTLI